MTDMTNLLKNMDKGPVTITFVKKNGKTRTAKVTRNKQLMAKYSSYFPKEWKNGGDAVAFFDLDKKDIRSFVASNLISVQPIQE